MPQNTRLTAMILCLCLLLGASGALAQAESADDTTAGSLVVQAILDSYSNKQFVAGQVDEADLAQILQSGAKAPSARNLQPWHFTVVTGNQVGTFINQAADGNVLIIISGLDDAGDGMNVDYDCGLASAYMYLAAQSLGYGAHIYLGGVSGINENQREALQIPDGYSAVMMMLVGSVQSGADAVSSATERNALEDTVTYIGQ